MTSFADFQSGHQDAVTVTRFNFYGTRLLTASSDHRVKVWDQDAETAQWTLTDTWRAHDGEVRDAAWNGPFTGQHLGTVGEDLRFHLWAEDSTQPRNSGRRFACVFRLISPVRAPFVSLDFRNVGLDSFCALITRDGWLTVLEPVNADDLAEWHVVDQFRVCGEGAAATGGGGGGGAATAASRGQETSFRLQFHRDPMDMTHILNPGWDSRSLSLVVAAMDTVKIYRTGANRQFYHALQLTGHTDLVRDVSWATGSVRGHDLIASGCKDGMVRIWEVYTSYNDKSSASSGGGAGRTALPKAAAAQRSPISTLSSALGNPIGGGGGGGVADGGGGSGSASNISSAFASASTTTPASTMRSPRLQAHYAAASTPGSTTPRPREGDPVFTHAAKMVACIDSGHMDVWQVEFSPAGDCLLSSGDDGTVRFWKKSVDGEWLEFAEADVGDD